MSTVPAGAERLDALMWVKFERLPSRLVPGFEQMKPVLTCPGCQRRSPQPVHGHPFACDCGLTVQLEGVTLLVWRAAPVPA